MEQFGPFLGLEPQLGEPLGLGVCQPIAQVGVGILRRWGWGFGLRLRCGGGWGLGGFPAAGQGQGFAELGGLDPLARLQQAPITAARGPFANRFEIRPV